MLVIDEMDDFDKYNDMKFCEFFEFLARFAELSYQESISLYSKICKLLSQMFSKFCKNGVIFPDLEKQTETDSDCDDDLVWDIKN